MIVLAAGLSARMGRPKPLLDFEGRSCLSLVLSACSRSRATETVLVLGAEAAALSAEARATRLEGGRESSGLKIVVNERFERGQTSSLKAGLDSLSGRADGFLVMPVDLPLVTSADLDALIGRFEEHRRGRTIFIATNEGERGHPVLFSSVHRAPLLELPDGDPVNGYIRTHEGETELVEVGNRGILMPLNTPDDYRKVLARYREAAGGKAEPS